MIRIHQLKCKVNHNKDQLYSKAAELLKIPVKDIQELTIIRQSVDARKKPDIFYNYSLDIKVNDENRILKKWKGKENQVSKVNTVCYQFPKSGEKKLKNKIVVVGMGPAGLFCAYELVLHGYPVLLLERGKSVEQRQDDVERFWNTGKLDIFSNVQFGEGGAGTFSDGKLNTLVKDKDGRNGEVLDILVKFGAKESIRYEAKPHIGTDALINVVRNMRQEIIRLGGAIRFQTQVTDLIIKDNAVTGIIINHKEKIICEQIVLAIGHSARDTFQMLHEKSVPMEAKSFAVGLRVEHPQKMINESQYGMADPGDLGAAPYKLTAKAKNQRSVYTFCMCPGGYVVNASSEEGRTAVNGMSYSGRSGENANSAVIVSVTPDDFGSESPLAGIAFQRELERKAYEIGQGKIPVQRYGSFKSSVIDKNYEQKDIMPESDIQPNIKGQYLWADVSRILPKDCNEAFIDGMESFSNQIPGFNRNDVVVSGVESRTSSPVRILRNEVCQSSVEGLYPCGEGAGYAGGITSAAMDGVRVAEQIAKEFEPNSHFTD